jgi:hypothetical protein
MRQQARASKEPAEKVVQDIRRATRKHYSAEEKIRIVLEGLRKQVERDQHRVAFRLCPWRAGRNGEPISSQATTSPSIRQDLAGRCQQPDAGRISTGH